MDMWVTSTFGDYASVLFNTTQMDKSSEAGAFLLGDIFTWVSGEVLTHRFGGKEFGLS